MKIKAKRFVRTVATGLALVQGFIFLPTTTLAASGKNAPHARAPYIIDYSSDVSRILSVLESKVDDQQLLQRIKDKLLTLDQRQMRLIASLSDRVVKDGNTTGSEVAFLLMTALITLL